VLCFSPRLLCHTSYDCHRPFFLHPFKFYHLITFHERYLTPIFPAINYRLSPQYPFPCAIQDALAAYLYLIRPPPEAKHKPVKPQHIVIMGDSAGGGLSLATLQVIRDSGLPPCAGGVLVSPWCDLSHSFPSIHTNTETVNSRPCNPSPTRH
jgi:acetyl esterase/lipase